MDIYKAMTDYIESLEIQQGRYAGQPFKLMSWQRRLLKGFCGCSGDVANTQARGGGKSTFAAAIVCCYFDGPLQQVNSEIVLVASSHQQAGVIFGHVVAFLGRDRLLDRRRYRYVSTHTDHYLKDLQTGISVRSAGADSRRLHGAAPVLMVYDELAQWPPGRIRSMLAALTTAAGKIPGSRALWIGTRPEATDHPFQQALDGKNRSVEYVQVHAARDQDPPFQRRTWDKANPGLKHLPDLLEAIKREAAAAKDNPELLSQFKALRLNLGTPDHDDALAGLMTPEIYRELEASDVLIEGDYILGLDVGGGHAQTAAAAVSLNRPHDVECLAAWPGIPALKDRAKGENRARYERMVDAGELLLQEGRRVVDLGEFLGACFDRWGRPYGIVCDRYRQSELMDTLASFGYHEDAVTWRGMGYRDGSEDLRRFQKIVTDRGARFRGSLLLRTAFAVARMVSDPAGNSKIAKQVERGGPGKDDAAVAVVVGLAEADRLAEYGISAGATYHFTPVEAFDAGWGI